MFTRTLSTPPRVATTLGVGAALALSTIPSLLPRSAPVQGLMTGLLVLLSLAALAVPVPKLQRLSRKCADPAAEPRTTVALAKAHRPAAPPPAHAPGAVPAPARLRWIVLAATSAALAGLAWVTHLSMTTRAAELGMAGPGPAYWLIVGAGAALVVGLGLGAVAQVRRIARLRWRRTPRPLAAALLAGVAVTTAAAGPVDVLAPLRKDLGPDHVMLTESAAGASRSFAVVDEAPTPEGGADLAVRRMVADGGLQRGAVLIALPTGSGWVNREAVTAIEAQLGGDVAVVSAQYSDLPSWWSFVLDQDPAIRSADALVAAVLSRVGELPPDRRPDIYLHGESLGALAGQAALEDVPTDLVCGVIWTGAPAGATSGHPRERNLHNADDPVVHLSSDTIFSEPEDWPTLWVPGLSYGTTVLDLGASLLPAAGHGHSYGPEQDWTLPTC